MFRHRHKSVVDERNANASAVLPDLHSPYEKKISFSCSDRIIRISRSCDLYRLAAIDEVTLLAQVSLRFFQLQLDGAQL